jgi:type VI secretion system FHA domain protein
VALTLRVTSFHSQALGAQSAKTFGAGGGSIGRKQGNDWVLPDPENIVSGNHAKILCRGGTYYLLDTSTNGTFVNGATQPIGNNREQALADGDLLQIGEYEIQVILDRNEHTGPTGFDLRGQAGHSTGFGATGPTGPTANHGYAAPDAPYGLPMGQPVGTDPLQYYEDRSGPRARPEPPPIAQPNHSSALDDYFEMPPIVSPPPAPPQPAGIPEDWDKTGYSQGSSRPGMPPPQYPPAQPPPQYPPQPHHAAHAPLPHVAPPVAPLPGDQVGALAAVLISAGMDANSARAVAAMPGLHVVLGSLLGVAIQGMLDVLKARTEIKSQFRVPVTSMRPVENNPLKFSANSAQALQNLLAGRNPAYLGPVEAFSEGFQDIKAHQIAMMAGMRAAFDSMVQRFEPEDLAERFQKRIKQAGLLGGLAGKGRYWEMYCDFFEELTQDADANFQRLFGDKFAQAYEDQMRRLTGVRR